MHAIIHVFTYKTGLLARMAHDLRLTIERHELTVQGRNVRGFCAADSLRVDGVPGNSGLDTNTLSAKDKTEIHDTIRSEILQSDLHPKIEFAGEVSGTGSKLQVKGTLKLRGQARPVAADLTRNGDHLSATLEITPSQFGIAPYKALAGAIKLQDRVRIIVDVLLEGQNPDTVLGGADAVQLTAAASK
ncbi:MAG: hypothetical protein RL701_7149 [Pseudomonadota bacterium]|jgi:hypothetical protein